MSQSELRHRSDVSDKRQFSSASVSRIGTVPGHVVHRYISYLFAQSLVVRQSNSLLRRLNGEQVLPDLLRHRDQVVFVAAPLRATPGLRSADGVGHAYPQHALLQILQCFYKHSQTQVVNVNVARTKYPY